MDTSVSHVTNGYDHSDVTNRHELVAEMPEQPASMLVDRPHRSGPIQDFILFWLDFDINLNDEFYQQFLARFQEIVFTVLIFKNIEEFMTNIKSIMREKILLIVSSSIGKNIIPQIHNMSQLDTIFVACENQNLDKLWTQQWSKLECVSMEIDQICKSLRNVIQQINRNTIAIKLAPKQTDANTNNRNIVEPSYMYMILLKQIILESKDDEKESVRKLVTHVRDKNIPESELNYFRDEYFKTSALCWYTQETFLYSMINKSMKDFDMAAMVTIGFFIQKLHCELKKLRQQQSNRFQEPFVVYRCLCMTQEEFQHVRNVKGGLLAFTCFLSTTLELRTATNFVQDDLLKHKENVCVLFIITIDPTKMDSEQIPFALINEHCATQIENEILFSINTIFHVSDVEESVEGDHQWDVQLTMIGDRDEQLSNIERCIQKESNDTGWCRMGKLMLKLGDFDQADELYRRLLEDTTNDGEKEFIYNQIAYSKGAQFKYQEELQWYQQILVIKKRLLNEDSPLLNPTYNKIALVYKNMGNYSKAIEYYERALDVREKTLPSTHVLLAASHNDIGTVYQHMGCYPRALEYYEKSHNILKYAVPLTHHNFSTCYNNIGEVYQHMGDYPKALEYYEKSLAIIENAVSETHPDLATCYNNIGEIHQHMGDYSKAIYYYTKALEIRENTLPSMRLDLAVSYNDLAVVFNNLADYTKALDYFEKSHNILKAALPPDHSSIAASYNNIGLVYNSMGSCANALEYFEKSNKILEAILPETHSSLATSNNNIGLIYYKMSDYEKALEQYEKALKIQKKILPATHPSLATTYDNIGSVYRCQGDNLRAIEYYEKALKIRERVLPPTHPDLAVSYNSKGLAYNNIGDYEKALEYFEKSNVILSSVLPPNHPDLATSYVSLGFMHKNMDDFSKALEYYDKAHEIFVERLPTTHPSLAVSYNNIGGVHLSLGNYAKALESYEKALSIGEKTVPPRYSNLATSYNNIGGLYTIIGDYPKALEYHEKVQQIYQENLAPTDLDLAFYYNNVGAVYCGQCDYSNAYEFLTKALDFFRNSLPSGHPNMHRVEVNIELVKKKMSL